VLIHVRDSAARERARAAFERDAERVGAGDRTSRAIETDIYVTNVCNIRCDYCYFYFEDYFVAPSHMQPKHPNLDHLKGIIDSVSGKTYTLVLLGGEPFSRPDIASLLAYIKEKDIFSTRVSTNGLLLTRNKSSLQFVDTLTISIDAMRIRQYPHHMNRLRKDLGQLRHEFGDSLPLVVPSWTTSPDDNFERDVVPFLDFARENNFIVKFLPLKVNQWPIGRKSKRLL
jgi:organic radical activating enzyme